MNLFKTMRVTILSALLMFACVDSVAVKVTIDHIVYNCNKSTGKASVQGCGDYYELKKVNIPDNILYEGKTYTVTSIAKDAFDGCYQISSVTMGNTIETIGSGAFSSTGVKTLKLSEGLTIIGAAAFSHCNITNLVLPENLKIIRASAFYCNHSLKTVKFGRSLNEIGNNAFDWCESLTAIDMPNSVTILGKEAFNDCFALKSVVLSTKLPSIPESAFENCPIENLVIPPSVTSIGNGAFCNNHIAVINIPATCRVIEPWAFCYGTGHTLNLAEGVTTIGESAFEQCTNLRKVVMPRSAVNVGKRVFDRCYSIESVTLQPTLKVIPEGMFYECSIKNLVIPEGVTAIDAEAFALNTELYTLSLPSSLRTVGRQSFIRCESLTDLSIKEGLETIGEKAFGAIHLDYLELPASLKNIGAEAFSNFMSIDHVIAKGTTPAVCGAGAFSNSTCEQAKLQVPEGCVEVYKAAPVWKDFRYIGTPSPSGVSDITDSSVKHDSVRYLDLQGRMVAHPVVGEIYLRVYTDSQGVTRTEKAIYN